MYSMRCELLYYWPSVCLPNIKSYILVLSSDLSSKYSFLVNRALKNNLSSHFDIDLTREVLLTLRTTL